MKKRELIGPRPLFSHLSLIVLGTIAIASFFLFTQTILAAEPVRIQRFDISPPKSQSVGRNITISWQVVNTYPGTPCTASGPSGSNWNGPRPASGQESVRINSPGENTFAITCSGPGGTASSSGGKTPVIDYFRTRGSSTVTYGSNTTVEWKASGGAVRCEGIGYGSAGNSWNGNSKSINGSQSVGPVTNLNSLLLRCYSSNGASAERWLTTQPSGLPAGAVSIDYFTADPNPIGVGGQSRLSWIAIPSNATCVASGRWNGTRGASGGETLPVFTHIGAYAYDLTCRNPANGSQTTRRVIINVKDAPRVEITANPEKLPARGGNTTISWKVSNADSCRAFDGWSGNKNFLPNGSSHSEAVQIQVPPALPRTFTLECRKNGSGETTRQAVVVGLDPNSESNENATGTINGVLAIDGKCGSATTETCLSKPPTGAERLCADSTSPTPVIKSSDDSWNWQCNGINGGGTASCKVDVCQPGTWTEVAP